MRGVLMLLHLLRFIPQRPVPESMGLSTFHAGSSRLSATRSSESTGESGIYELNGTEWVPSYSIEGLGVERAPNASKNDKNKKMAGGDKVAYNFLEIDNNYGEEGEGGVSGSVGEEAVSSKNCRDGTAEAAGVQGGVDSGGRGRGRGGRRRRSKRVVWDALASLTKLDKIFPERDTSVAPKRGPAAGEYDKDPSSLDGALKVLFLSADTGGGHRASSEALAKEMQSLHPNTTYALYDIWTEDGSYPYNTLVDSYTYTSSRYRIWRAMYHFSNLPPTVAFMNWQTQRQSGDKITSRIAKYDPDVIVSIHPTMTCVPQKSVETILDETGKKIPIFTVVTDLGSGHATWFTRGAEKIFVASDRIHKLARVRGWVPPRKLVKCGLPIRRDFSEQRDKLGSRWTEEGKSYQAKVRSQLDLPSADRDHKVVLLMGGGEGVGSLGSICKAMVSSVKERNVNATVVVVCGRNEKLKTVSAPPSCRVPFAEFALS